MVSDGELAARVGDIYRRLDEQIATRSRLCGACGKCCDFEQFDHRLYVTSPEMEYLAAKLGAGNVKKMETGRCPYNIEGKCGIYENRFAGCRIFCCKGDEEFQSGLSEAAIRKLKDICGEFDMPYRYTDLKTALNGFGG